MKAEDIGFGDYPVGAFRIQVREPALPTQERGSYFEVMIFEEVGNASLYVNLITDPRFAWFDWLPKFEHKIQDADMVTYNTYVDRVSLAMPTWQLHRQSIANLMRRCEDLVKAAKKAPKKK